MQRGMMVWTVRAPTIIAQTMQRRGAAVVRMHGHVHRRGVSLTECRNHTTTGPVGARDVQWRLSAPIPPSGGRWIGRQQSRNGVYWSRAKGRPVQNTVTQIIYGRLNPYAVSE